MQWLCTPTLAVLLVRPAPPHPRAAGGIALQAGPAPAGGGRVATATARASGGTDWVEGPSGGTGGMSSRQQMQTGGGFSNCVKAPYTRETVDVLREMMHESKLNKFQLRQLNRRLQEGDSLPVSCNPTSSLVLDSTPLPPATPVRAQLPTKPQLRTAESCRAGDAYQRERFRPRPTRNLEREKQRLQNIMATGKDGPTPDTKQKHKEEEEEEKPEIDRFDELCDEIEERRQFLEQMESFGRGKEFRGIIHTEISQKLREMEQIDRRRSSELKQQMEMDKMKKEYACS
ncbi:UPF0193 protein EVG1 [Leucoraja erinacea]|uniref:UPF0193 protein EVG1 n=1 Tax=Leucoraja erinaceus TaxID=7782 RepID=UPI002456F201|nr:UPF0193 protein EVG1 [Leucoraja erinacea]